MALPAKKVATYQDVLSAPRHVVAEIVHGTLHTHPRPAILHAGAAGSLSWALTGAFRFGRGGPGGWVILDEPELHLRENIVVPDLAGWRRTRMPEIPSTAYIELPPDWVCEVLSPSTAGFDRGDKLPLSAAQGVTHAWLIDSIAQTVEVLRLDGSSYRLITTVTGSAEARLEPFDAVPLLLGDLWAR